jgi:hypothetical protein
MIKDYEGGRHDSDWIYKGDVSDFYENLMRYCVDDRRYNTWNHRDFECLTL